MKLIVKIKQGGSFGYTAVLPESAAGQNPAVKIKRVFAHPDPSKVREFADDVRGKFVLPIGRRMPLHEAAEAHVLGGRLNSLRSSRLNRLSRSYRRVAWTEMPSADTPSAPNAFRANHGHTACATDGLTFDTKA